MRLLGQVRLVERCHVLDLQPRSRGRASGPASQNNAVVLAREVRQRFSILEPARELGLIANRGLDIAEGGRK